MNRTRYDEVQLIVELLSENISYFNQVYDNTAKKLKKVQQHKCQLRLSFFDDRLEKVLFIVVDHIIRKEEQNIYAFIQFRKRNLIKIIVINRNDQPQKVFNSNANQVFVYSW